jgi:hypothetical protein
MGSPEIRPRAFEEPNAGEGVSRVSTPAHSLYDALSNEHGINPGLPENVKRLILIGIKASEGTKIRDKNGKFGPEGRKFLADLAGRWGVSERYAVDLSYLVNRFPPGHSVWEICPHPTTLLRYYKIPESMEEWLCDGLIDVQNGVKSKELLYLEYKRLRSEHEAYEAKDEEEEALMPVQEMEMVNKWESPQCYGRQQTDNLVASISSLLKSYDESVVREALFLVPWLAQEMHEGNVARSQMKAVRSALSL